MCKETHTKEHAYILQVTQCLFALFAEIKIYFAPPSLTVIFLPDRIPKAWPRPIQLLLHMWCRWKFCTCTLAVSDYTFQKQLPHFWLGSLIWLCSNLTQVINVHSDWQLLPRVSGCIFYMDFHVRIFKLQVLGTEPETFCRPSMHTLPNKTPSGQARLKSCSFPSRSQPQMEILLLTRPESIPPK